MADISRRKILPLAGAVATAPLFLGAHPVGPQLDPANGWGIQLRLQWEIGKGWVVPVVDWDAIANYYPGGWKPGIAPQFKHIPLKEFMKQLNKELNLPPDA